MSWNHRVLAHKQGEDVWFEIHEVYYNEKGTPNGYTSETTPLSVGCDTLEGLKWVLEKMTECLQKPVLWANPNFPKEYTPCEQTN